jgi:tRNA (cytidine/uridine-2'-O-)-methyltransferase
MDYWREVTWQRWPDWGTFRAAVRPEARLWYVESHGPRVYSDTAFRLGDYLVFGRESAGLPRTLLESNPAHWLHIPMLNPRARSLNLSNCVALVLYEALRQHGFAPGAA